MTFLVNNLEHFTFKTSIHKINTRSVQLYKLPTNLTSYQKGIYNAGIRTFNALPKDIAYQVMNKQCFIVTLKSFLLDKCFYKYEEFFTSAYQ
jgi:hypothetical protein